MPVSNNLLNAFAKLQSGFKSFFIVIILLLIFFSVNLFITLKNKPKSAYSVLNSNSESEVEKEKSKLMLQDTRVHNWDEIQQKKK